MTPLGGKQDPASDPAIQTALMRREMALEQNLVQAQEAAFVAQQQLAADVNAIETYNGEAAENNERVQLVLKSVTGEDLGTDGAAWQKWWTNQQGYAYRSPQTTDVPTFDENVSLWCTTIVWCHRSPNPSHAEPTLTRSPGRVARADPGGVW